LFVAIASRDLVSQSLSDYRYSPWGTPWAGYTYPGDQNLGVEADAGYCFNPSPTIYKNAFSFASGLDEDKSGEKIRLLTDGKGNWIPSAAVYTAYPSLLNGLTPLTNDLFQAGGISTYSVAVSKSGVVVINEGGSLNLTPNKELSLDTGSILWTGKETLNLNTGEDTWQFTAQESAVGQFGCTFSGTLSASAHTFIDVVLRPAAPISGLLSITNPAGASVGQVLPLPVSVDPLSVINAPAAAALSADGRSAAAVVFQSSSTDPVTFSLSASESTGESQQIGTLTAFEPTFLSSPSPGKSIDGQGQRPSNPGCGRSGPQCSFLALLWPPDSIPVSTNDLENLVPHNLTLTVRAIQDGVTVSENIILQPPPLVLVHGIWSDAGQAWSSFKPWLEAHYPNAQLVFTADYGKYSALTFENFETQQVLALTISDTLNYAAAQNTVATSVDVIGHSMGGLVTRYFMDNGAPAPFATGTFPKNVVHRLITIGTPHSGSELATFLWEKRDVLDVENSDGDADSSMVALLCHIIYGRKCSVEEFFKKPLGKDIDSGVLSLESGYSSSQPYWGIQGLRPQSSYSLDALNTIIGDFEPGYTVDGILHTSYSDTIVAGPSQVVRATKTSCIPDVVHTALVCAIGKCTDVGETVSRDIWNQALYWLMGGQGQYYSPSGSAPACAGSSTASGTGNTADILSTEASSASSSTPAPIFDLTSYTQVSASNVTILPASGTSLTVGATTNITANSTTKALSQLLLFQEVTNPSDQFELYKVQGPFSVPFTPYRLGSASFVAVAIFTDKTYAVVPTSFTFIPSGKPLSLYATGPASPLPVGLSTTVPATALLPNGYVDVTNEATYSSRSGETTVFSIGSDGSITAVGNGVDWLDITYGGLTTSAQISVEKAGTRTQAVAAPTFSPGSGAYDAPLLVSISDSTLGSSIYFTTDGSIPTTSSTKYAAPISVNGTETINAIAAAAEYTNSPVVSAKYTIKVPEKTSTTTSLSGTPDTNLVTGETLTLKVVVKPVSGSSVPTGTIVLASPDTPYTVTVPLGSDGTTVYKTTVPAPGSYRLYAIYSGSTSLTGSTSQTLSATVK